MTELLNLLFDSEVFKEHEYEESLREHKSLPPILGILSMGYGTQDDVYKIAKNKLKVPALSESDLINIDINLLNLIPSDLIKKYAIIPFFIDGHYLKLGMLDPTDDEAMGEISFFTDKMIIPYIAMPSILAKYINKYYDLNFPEEFQFGINQHLKEEFSKDKMFSKDFEVNHNSSLPSVPKSSNEKPDLPNKPNLPSKPKLPSKPNLSSKPNLPKSNKIILPQNRELEITGLNLQNIISINDKDELFNAVSLELSKIVKTGIMFLVRGTFLQSVSSTQPFDTINISLEESSIFKDVFLSHEYYIGPPYMNMVMKNFVFSIEKEVPKSILLMPIMYPDMIFAMLYTENLENLTEITQIRDAVSKAFSMLVN